MARKVIDLIRDVIRKYSEQTTLRALIKAVPRFGEPFDFWLTEKYKKTASIVENRWANEPYTSRLQAIQKIITHRPFKGNVVWRSRSFAPRVELLKKGHLQLDKQQKARSKQYKDVLDNKKRPNDPCAVLTHDPIWTDDPLFLNYYSAFYSEILALREQNIRLITISSNVLVYCEEARCLLIHRRSEESAYFASTLHTFGGAYMPPGVGKRHDYNGLIECAERELSEETGLSVTIPNTIPVLLLEEPSISFIEMTYLGVNISNEQLERSRPSWEGGVVKISFDELKDKICDFDEWTPSGLLHILFWLALDTPNSKERLKFAGEDAAALLKEVVKRVEQYEIE